MILSLPPAAMVPCVKCLGVLLLKARLVTAQLDTAMVREGSWLRSNKSHTCNTVITHTSITQVLLTDQEDGSSQSRQQAAGQALSWQEHSSPHDGPHLQRAG